MKILLIKTSSMGDIIHSLPAITEAASHVPNLEVDWVVEEGFATIPKWHPNVNRVLPVAIRRWRKNFFKARKDSLWKAFNQAIKSQTYDHIIDAQGLLKSAWLGKKANGLYSGLNRRSAREPLSALFYKNKIDVPFGQHAVDRVRQLFGKVLGYEPNEQWLDYGIKAEKTASESYVVFIHGTTWATKHWPENYWIELAENLVNQGIKIKLPWGSEHERLRAERIKQNSDAIEVLPKLNLTELKDCIANAKAALSVDTGLAHLTAALSVPNISLFGPTNPGLTRPYGYNQQVLSSDLKCAPCLKRDCKLEPNVQEGLSWPPCFRANTPNAIYDKIIELL